MPVNRASFLLLENTNTAVINENEIVNSDTNANPAPRGPGEVIA